MAQVSDVASRAGREESEARAGTGPLLYCPACASEYPLTFEICPADGIRLTTRKPRARIIERAGSIAIPGSPEIPVAPSPEPPADEKANEAEPIFSESNDDELQESLREAEGQVASGGNVFGYESVIGDPDEPDYVAEQRPGSFQIAAFAISIGLIIFALIAFYTLIFGGRHKPAIQQPARISEVTTEKAVETSSPLIPTPDEARFYDEDKSQSSDTGGRAQIAQPQEQNQSIEREAAPSPRKADSSEQRPSPQTSKINPTDKPPPAHAPARKVIDVSSPVPSEATDGRVWADLVRVRPRRSASGYRYDLTFNLRERVGRPLHWDRLTISAVSATGQRHNQAVGFPYFLGAGGMLTFTVSLEMPGATEGDWRGRVVCWAFGEDPAGRRVRASFGATVAPW